MRLWWALRLALLLLIALAGWLLAIPAPLVGAAAVAGLGALFLIARGRKLSGNVRALNRQNDDAPKDAGSVMESAQPIEAPRDRSPL